MNRQDLMNLNHLRDKAIGIKMGLAVNGIKRYNREIIEDFIVRYVDLSYIEWKDVEPDNNGARILRNLIMDAYFNSDEQYDLAKKWILNEYDGGKNV